MFVVSLLSRFIYSLSKYHYGVVKRVLIYIKGTLNYDICYEQVKDFKLYSYIDSD